MSSIIYRAVLLLAANGLLLATGCSGSGRNESDFIPASDNARKALESALKSWQAGQSPGTVAGTASPTVQVIDSRWQAGQKLLSFEILNEESDAQGRFFRVRLDVGKAAPVEVRYVVIGIDPLLVYREEDYQKLSGTGQ
jgi:hypothetical protein